MSKPKVDIVRDELSTILADNLNKKFKSQHKVAYYLDGSTITITALGGDGGINKEIKIIGLVPEMQSLANPTNLVQGVSMPFIDVLCKFNVHIHGSTGTAGAKLTA